MTLRTEGSAFEAEYWDTVITEWRAGGAQRLWRAHSDAINVDLCRRWWPRKEVNRMLKTDLFDEACAEGLFPFLSATVPAVYGIDCSIEVAHVARARLGAAPITAADVRRLPFADGSFELVVSNSTLDHFERREEIEKSLREIHRVVTTDGRLILTLDNPANPLVALRNSLPFWLTNRLSLVPYFVGATCGPWRGARMLADAGFSALAVTAVVHCPRVLAVAACAVCQRIGGVKAQRRLLRLLMAFEHLERWPSRYQTGHYVAILAQKAGRRPA
jgi:ubiquinone/menaquinone biosynthesis C-methylase UbiE